MCGLRAKKTAGLPPASHNAFGSGILIIPRPNSIKNLHCIKKMRLPAMRQASAPSGLGFAPRYGSLISTWLFKNLQQLAKLLLQPRMELCSSQSQRQQMYLLRIGRCRFLQTGLAHFVNLAHDIIVYLH